MEIGKELIYLSRKDILDLGMPMSVCIDLMETAHKAKCSDQILMPSKLNIQATPDLFVLGMGCSIKTTGATGIKWLSGCATNREKNIPRFTGVIVLNDIETGAPVCIMDATEITALRTAAVSGMGLRHLANKNSRIVCVYGCGMEGRSNLEAAMSECPEITRVQCWAPRKASVEQYITDMSQKYPALDFVLCEDPRDALKDADIFLGSSPVTHGDEYRIIEKDWIKPGLTAVPVNQDTHFLHETLQSFHRMFVDDNVSFDICKQNGHYKYIPQSPPQMGELLLGKAEGRKSPEENIILFTEGVGVNDIICGDWFYQKALETGKGTLLPL